MIRENKIAFFIDARDVIFFSITTTSFIKSNR